MQAENREHLKRFGVGTALFLMALLIAMKSRLNPLVQGGLLGTDGAVFRYMGWAMTKGLVPYRDTFDHKGIFLYLINYLGTLMGGVKGAWIFELLAALVSVVVAYRLARRYLNGGMSLIVVLTALAPLSEYFYEECSAEEFALPFQIIALFIFVDYFSHKERYEAAGGQKSFLYIGGSWFNMGVFINGACFAAVLLIRANMVSLWIVFCIMVLVSCIKEKKTGLLVKFLVSFLLGAALICAPCVAYLAANNAFGDFIRDYFVFNLRYSSSADMDVTVGVLAMVVFFAKTVGSIVSVIALVTEAVSKERREMRFFNIGYLVCFLVTLLFISMAGQPYSHYGITLLPLYIYPLSILFRNLRDAELKKVKIDILVVAYLLITVAAPAWAAFATQVSGDIVALSKSTVSKGMYEDGVVEFIRAATNENDRIAVYGNRDHYYLYSERLPASRYSYQTPIGTVNKAIFNEFFADLQKTPPKVIVSTMPDDALMQDFVSRSGYTVIAQTESLALYALGIE